MSVAPDRPWAPDRTRSAVRGRVVVRLAPGEAPERIPHANDIATRGVSAALSVDGGPIDQILRRHSHASRVTRAFRAAAAIGASSARPLWDDLEEELGFSRTFRIEVDPDASVLSLVQALAELGAVESASPEYLSVTPFDDPRGVPRPKDPWYAQAIVGSAEALAYEAGDSALICAIVDSGVDLDHPELAGRLRPGFDTVDLPADQVSRGLRFLGDTRSPDRLPRDEMGHGTACAGIVGARGVKLPRGLGGACRVLPVRVLAGARTDRGGRTAIGAIPDIDAGVKTAVDLGARVLNLSFGTPEEALRPDDPRPHTQVVAYARRRGCVLVAASGNNGARSRYYPACLDGVVAVGSVGPDQTPSSFTTRGDHVDLSAPGEHVPSASLGGWSTHTGTSFAAPFVSGAAALLLARSARYGRPLSADGVRDLLMDTARPFPRGSDSTGCGTGVLDAPAALRALERRLAAADSPSSRAFRGADLPTPSEDDRS